MRKILPASIFVLILFVSFSKLPAFAADLSAAKNTISTSRPSASSPLNADLGATDTQATIYDNGSFYLASDSAKIVRTSSGAVIDPSTIVSSQSAALTTVFFSEQVGTAAQAGTDVLVVPITAVHTIQFTTVQDIPAGGSVLITFPGSADNTASPSASQFAFNGLDATSGVGSNVVTNNITCNTNSFVTSPQIMCETTSLVAGGTTITIILGCSAQSSGACTTQVPSLINPTKSANAGTADIWKIEIMTRDAGDGEIDSRTVSIGTIDSVTIRANVDPTLSFTIAGVANGVDVSTGNGTGCLQVEDTNSGQASTATEVTLGLLANTPAADNKVGNIAAQLLTVSTNAPGGYVITATSSGQLINPSSGYFLASSTSPAAFPSSGADWFGVHACGLDTYDGTTISTTYWNTAASDTACGTCVAGSTSCPDATSGTNMCKYGWPTATTPITIAADPNGPVGNSLTAGNGLTSVSYAAGADAGVPAGEYSTVVTYVATPTF